jgi:hypothetical protein
LQILHPVLNLELDILNRSSQTARLEQRYIGWSLGLGDMHVLSLDHHTALSHSSVIFLGWVNLGSPWWSRSLTGLDSADLIS